MDLSVKENISLEDMAHDDLVFATISREEVERLDYSTITKYINELENSKDDPMPA